MMLFILTALSSLVAIVPVVSAQSALYGQCGGINWTGPTTCVAGSTCTYSNAYYSQCLPSSNAPSSVPSNSPTSAPLSSSHSSVSSVSGSSTAGASGPSSSPAVGNPYTGYSVFLSPVYTAEVQAGAANVADATTQSKALSVANIPTFIWFDQVAKVPSLDTYLTAAENLANTTGQKQLVQIVIYDLPNRDCAAKASNGEFTIANNGVANYENYIDQIVAIIKEHPTIRIVAIIEPDSLANLVTNLDVQACATAETAYKTCVTYAIQQLSTVGVYSYLDAGHAGWLGWPANLSPAAQLFGQLYTSAGSPAGVRGLATNVANYNSLTTTSPDPITQGNPNYDEMLYITALAPMLSSQGFPAHFIVEQARSGVQDIRNQWGDWCNIKGAGFGIRPNSNNTGSSLIDSIVWVKPGGESDGTSNTTSPRYDPTCSLSDATVPAPEAGTWFQAAFQTLVTAANPPL